MITLAIFVDAPGWFKCLHECPRRFICIFYVVSYLFLIYIHIIIYREVCLSLQYHYQFLPSTAESLLFRFVPLLLFFAFAASSCTYPWARWSEASNYTYWRFWFFLLRGILQLSLLICCNLECYNLAEWFPVLHSQLHLFLHDLSPVQVYWTNRCTSLMFHIRYVW